VGIVLFAIDKGGRRRKSRTFVALYFVFYFGKDIIPVASAISVSSAHHW